MVGLALMDHGRLADRRISAVKIVYSGEIAC
jgi:hypothetical protein